MRTTFKMILTSLALLVSTSAFADTLQLMHEDRSTLTVKRDLSNYHGVHRHGDFSDAIWLQGRNCKIYEVISDSNPPSAIEKDSVYKLSSLLRFRNELSFGVFPLFAEARYLNISCNPGFLSFTTTVRDIENDFNGAIDIDDNF